MEHPDRVFTTLIHRMDVDFLREAYHRLRKDGEAGLSGVTVKDYGRELEANLIDLHERLKNQRYVAPPIKRVWIDKEGGKKRPIGLLEIEDKIVQKAVSMLMGAVYEQDFHPFSYGFREGRNAHQALGEIPGTVHEARHTMDSTMQISVDFSTTLIGAGCEPLSSNESMMVDCCA